MAGTSQLNRAKRASWQTSPGRKAEGEAEKEAGESKVDQELFQGQPTFFLFATAGREQEKEALKLVETDELEKRKKG